MVFTFTKEETEFFISLFESLDFTILHVDDSWMDFRTTKEDSKFYYIFVHKDHDGYYVHPSIYDIEHSKLLWSRNDYLELTVFLRDYLPEYPQAYNRWMLWLKTK